jgi:peptide/nickel transport system permease protein
VAVPIGIISAVRQYSAFDITVTTLSFAGQAIPEFFLGLVLILVFYAFLKNPLTGGPLLPVGGMQSLTVNGAVFWDRITHLILPVTTGALGWIAWYSRFLRSSMLDVIHKDYLRTARAKGLPEHRVVLGHALRNALVPIVTVIGLTVALMIGGAVVTETVFGLPGVGNLVVSAVTRRDYPVIQGALLVVAAIYVVINFLIDLLYTLVDPRVKV